MDKLLLEKGYRIRTLPNLAMENKKKRINISSAISKYNDNIYLELQDRWNNWKIDLSKKEIYELVGGILSRQVTILTQYATSLNFWNGDVAPIILRSLADNYINLAWILKKPEDRAKKFILYGLGQAKLNLEHRKQQMERDGLDPSNDPLIEATQKWIDGQRYTFLTEVNLGSWSEMNTRTMAEEAGCIDFYNYVYQPFSSACHNMWNHISRYNLIYSDNPLHMLLLKPIVERIPPEVEYLELGAKYLAKMFDLFDNTFNYKSSIRSSIVILKEELSRIESEIKDQKMSEQGESDSQDT